MAKIFETIHNADHANIGANMRGEFGEAIAKLLYIQNGWRVSDAAGNYPYDFVIERHDEIRRVQVKTVVDSDSVNFKTSDEFDTAVIVAGDGAIYIMPRAAMHFTSAGLDASRSKFRLTAAHKSAYRAALFTPIEML